MTSKELAYQYRLAQWSALAKERGELGMSIRAFCAMKGFAENTYFYWQRRLREAAGKQMCGETTSLTVPGFAAVQLAEKASMPPGTGQLRIEMNGMHLTTDGGYPPEKLAALLRELRGLC